MKKLVVALVAGFLFALGLGVSGMTNPDKIIGFLDITGAWDPSLALVMAGALAVHVGAAQWALRASRPLVADSFAFPRAKHVDAPLIIGAALFGLGWGVAGLCPGPALVDLVAPSPAVVAFVLAMIASIAVFRTSALAFSKLNSQKGKYRHSVADQFQGQTNPGP